MDTSVTPEEEMLLRSNGYEESVFSNSRRSVFYESSTAYNHDSRVLIKLDTESWGMYDRGESGETPRNLIRVVGSVEAHLAKEKLLGRRVVE